MDRQIDRRLESRVDLAALGVQRRPELDERRARARREPNAVVRLDAGDPRLLQDAQRLFVGKLDDRNLSDPPDEIRVVLEGEVELVRAACAHDAHRARVAVHVGRQRLDLIAVERVEIVDEHDDADLFLRLNRQRGVEEALDRLLAARGVVRAGERHEPARRDRDPMRALQHPPIRFRLRILSGDGALNGASRDRRLGAGRGDQHGRLGLDAHERVEDLVGFAVAADDRRLPALLRKRAFVVGQILADDRPKEPARRVAGSGVPREHGLERRALLEVLARPRPLIEAEKGERGAEGTFPSRPCHGDRFHGASRVS